LFAQTVSTGLDVTGQDEGALQHSPSARLDGDKLRILGVQDDPLIILKGQVCERRAIGKQVMSSRGMPRATPPDPYEDSDTDYDTPRAGGGSEARRQGFSRPSHDLAFAVLSRRHPARRQLEDTDPAAGVTYVAAAVSDLEDCVGKVFRLALVIVGHQRTNPLPPRASLPERPGS
jgi:hypothetical protein